MSSITVTISGSSEATTLPQYRYWKQDSTYYREGIRDGKMVKDKYLTGGDLSKFLTGGGTKDTDYELVDQVS